jgi:hypothetical protein
MGSRSATKKFVVEAEPQAPHKHRRSEMALGSDEFWKRCLEDAVRKQSGVLECSWCARQETTKAGGFILYLCDSCRETNGLPMNVDDRPEEQAA